MTAAGAVHRLDGLEPDNLLAFLALLGLLRALEAVDRELPDPHKFCARAAWDLDHPPLRPLLALARQTSREEAAEAIARGIESISADHDFGDAKDPKYSPAECRALLELEAQAAGVHTRGRADLYAGLMSDAAGKRDKDETEPTPLCLLFGQGHQHFLERLVSVPRDSAPLRRGRGKSAVNLSAAQCLMEALFQPWHRTDPTPSFRWDPQEDVRYALMPGDPTDAAYKAGTQHGANRLAASGLAALTLVPEARAGHVRPAILGGAFDAQGFSFAWPVWREPATLAGVRALLAHPRLREPAALTHLGVECVLLARRISVGKFMNITRARAIG